MPRKLTDEQIEAYLDSRPGWAILSTMDSDGLPHTVPLGYFRLGRDIIMGVRDRTHKVANVESNPNVSILLEDGSSMADIRGVMFQGHARIVREPSEALQLAREGGPGTWRGRTRMAHRTQTGLRLHPHDTRSDCVMELRKFNAGSGLASPTVAKGGARNCVRALLQWTRK